MAEGTTNIQLGTFAEMIAKENTWAKTWKVQDVGSWRERAAAREAGRDVVMAKRPYSGRMFSSVDFDGVARSDPRYREPEGPGPRPPGTMVNAAYRPTLPGQPAATPLPPRSARQVRQHMRRLHGLFNDDVFSADARFEFAELSRLLPPASPRRSARRRTPQTLVPTPPVTPERRLAPLHAMISIGLSSLTTSRLKHQAFDLPIAFAA
jgi:hypothetical protein